MLKSLHISNYALIDTLDINFGAGFSAITGETGAGKSIIIGALSLIIGQRAETKSIKEGEDKCVVEAEFDISKYNLKTLFDENELDLDENSCIIRRELTTSGKSRAFVNDTPVSLNILRDLSSHLIDIHSQHENLLLGNDDYQRNVVDTMAHNGAILDSYRVAFQQWKNTSAELAKFKNLASKQLADLDYMKFQWQQLSDFKLVDGEQEELEQELDLLNHAEEIKNELFKTNTLLINDENASLPLIKDALLALGKVKAYIPSGDDLYNRLESSYIEIKDVATEINSIEEHVEFNPERLSFVETRLSELFSLLKKFNAKTVAELIEQRDNLELQLQKIESFDDDILKLEKEIAQALDTLKKRADALTDSRKKISKTIEKQLTAELSELGMPNAQVQIAVSPLSEYGIDGNDDVSILFSANKNRAPQPVSQIASGGEISRVMLALKSLMANQAGLPTIIFDEIDTGVSGEIAHRMGEIMKKMSKAMQVFAITHLPQIASKGDAHYRVYKTEKNNHVYTSIEKLSEESRVAEIAQMLSGSKITDSAIQNAKDLLHLK